MNFSSSRLRIKPTCSISPEGRNFRNRRRAERCLRNTDMQTPAREGRTEQFCSALQAVGRDVVLSAGNASLACGYEN
jgi:hypothetical protein